VLGFNSIYRDARLCAYDVGVRGVLLLFLRGASLRYRPSVCRAVSSRRMTATSIRMAFSIAANRVAFEVVVFA
jgi:hypothetical protein